MSEDRTARSVHDEVRRSLAAGELDLPDPGRGRTARRWAALAELGRRDLAVARLAEGHTDAVAVLHEADREPEPGALYEVWASKAGGTGARLREGVLTGTVRFCSGAHSVDRALVAAETDEGKSSLVEVAMTGPRIRRDDGGWHAQGMADADNGDVTFERVEVREDAIVGPLGFYTERPGFWWGGAGVAAVWWGGCAGILDRVTEVLGKPDEHKLAHLGALHPASRAAWALLDETARAIDANPGHDARMAVMTSRAAVEALARDVLDRAPRITGPGPMAWHAGYGRHLADLQLYVRQHHGERDLAELGRLVVEAAR